MIFRKRVPVDGVPVHADDRNEIEHSYSVERYVPDFHEDLAHATQLVTIARFAWLMIMSSHGGSFGSIR